PLSGAFVDMLRRLVTLAGSSAAAEASNAANEAAGSRAAQVVPPTRVLDGYGAFSTPPPTARPIPSNYTERGSLDHPPGFYGPPEGLVAVNTLAPDDRPVPLDASSLNARVDISRRAGIARDRRAGGDLAFGRPVDHASAPPRQCRIDLARTVMRSRL